MSSSSEKFKSKLIANRYQMIIGTVVSLIHIWFNMISIIPSLWQNAIHFASFVILVGLLNPFFAKLGLSKSLRYIDIGISILVVLSTFFILYEEDKIYARGLKLSYADWIAGFILILSAIEFARRVAGWFIPFLIIVSIGYISWLGSHITGVFRFAGLSLDTILFRSIYGDDALFGSIATISSTYVFMFMLFGAFLIRSGAGDFVVDLARAVAGKFVGGSGFVAVLGSALTGTISGSSIANTASTGIITIPLMKRSGFPAKFAAAVEASASTGGQLMPPIMGAGAFIMATYTQISYTTIVLISTLPAVLYFLTVGFFVRIEAKRSNLISYDDKKYSVIEIIKKGGIVFILPLFVLSFMLIYGFTPTYAAGVSILSVIISSWFTPAKMKLKQIIEALAMGAENMVLTAILLCSVGLIVNVTVTTGIGNTFSLMIVSWAGNSLVLAFILIAIASLILGVGLPVTAAYIILATLSAPALYALMANEVLIDMMVSGNLPDAALSILAVALPDQVVALSSSMSKEVARSIVEAIPVDMLSIVRDSVLSKESATYTLLAAHLVIFWLSQDSNVTPPVALTAFTAAAIAGTKPMQTGFEAWKLSKGLYIIPLLFIYTPLVTGNAFEIVYTFLFAIVGLYSLAAGISGYMESPLGFILRLITLLIGLAIIYPSSVWLNVLGCVLLFIVFIINKRADKQATV